MNPAALARTKNNLAAALADCAVAEGQIKAVQDRHRNTADGLTLAAALLTLDAAAMRLRAARTEVATAEEVEKLAGEPLCPRCFAEDADEAHDASVDRSLGG